MFCGMSEITLNDEISGVSVDEWPEADSDEILGGRAFSGALLLGVALIPFNIMAFLSGATLAGLCLIGSCAEAVVTEAQRNWTMNWKMSGACLVLMAGLSVFNAVKGRGRPLSIAAIVVIAPAAFFWLLTLGFVG